MVNLEAIKSKKNPRGRPLLTEPMNPDRVLAIVYKRDIENKRWEQIVEEIGLSRQALFLLYKKWREWALPIIYKKEV